MVFLAVLRDPARLYRGFPLDSGKAVGRDGDVRVDPAAVLPALARYLACALGELPPAVQAVLLAADRRCADPGYCGAAPAEEPYEIGRTSCRARVCQYG